MVFVLTLVCLWELLLLLLTTVLLSPPLFDLFFWCLFVSNFWFFSRSCWYESFARIPPFYFTSLSPRSLASFLLSSARRVVLCPFLIEFVFVLSALSSILDFKVVGFLSRVLNAGVFSDYLTFEISRSPGRPWCLRDTFWLRIIRSAVSVFRVVPVWLKLKPGPSSRPLERYVSGMLGPEFSLR